QGRAGETENDIYYDPANGRWFKRNNLSTYFWPATHPRKKDNKQCRERSDDADGFGRIRGRMEIKCDFSSALVFVSFLTGDPDRGGPGPRGVEQIHAGRRQMPVLQSELVRASDKQARRHGVFHLDISPAGTELRLPREVQLFTSPPGRSMREPTRP